MYVNVVMLRILTESTVTPNTQHQTCYSLLTIPTQLTKIRSSIWLHQYISPTKKRLQKHDKKTLERASEHPPFQNVSTKKHVMSLLLQPNHFYYRPINCCSLASSSGRPVSMPANRHRFERFFWLEKIPGCLTKSAKWSQKRRLESWVGGSSSKT